MTQAKMLANGNLLVPMRAEADGLIGDGMIELEPGDEQYKEWFDYFNTPASDDQSPDAK